MNPRVIFFLFSLAALSVAGPNSTARLYISFGSGSTTIDSLGTCPSGDSITAGIIITGAKELFDYQVFLSYDTSQLKFISGEKGTGASPNILETNGGSMFFNCNISRNDPSRVLIGGSLLGDDIKQCGNGSGIPLFCYISQKKH